MQELGNTVYSQRARWCKADRGAAARCPYFRAKNTKRALIIEVGRKSIRIYNMLLLPHIGTHVDIVHPSLCTMDQEVIQPYPSGPTLYYYFILCTCTVYQYFVWRYFIQILLGFNLAVTRYLKKYRYILRT
jgi:hypothetical protein